MGRGAEGWAGWDWCLWLPLLEGLWLSGEGFGGFFPLFCWVGLSKLFKGWEGALYFFVFPHRFLKPCPTPVRKGNLIFIEGSLYARYSVGCFTSWLMISACVSDFRDACNLFPVPRDQSHIPTTSRACDAEAKEYLLTPYLDYLLPFLPSVGRSFCCDGKGRKEASI